MKKKLKIEFLDNRDVVKKTHEFMYEVIAGKGARIRVTFNGETFFLEEALDPEPDWKDVVLGDDQQWATEYKGEPEEKRLLFVSGEGKPEKLFCEQNLIPVWTVSYIHPTVGYKGEALYITVSAKDEQAAKTEALACNEFNQHIVPEYYDARYLKVFKPQGNYKIGEVQYFEGDPRL